MSSDGLESVWSAFFTGRTKPLGLRYPGRYRALVVETNDPLRMHRIRFKCPELHDFDLKSEECPWAVPSHDMGNRRSGRWTHPCIGDWIWIEFEKNHPYGPVWSGFATPTRRKFYALPAIFGETPVPVDEKSDVEDAPKDFQSEYMPKDERPMSHGWADRYGNLDMHSSVGFFPKEHDVEPPPADLDAMTQANFKQRQAKPEANQPDVKYMVRISKYGQLFQQSDVGYIWKKGDSSGEFEGDFDRDEEFEVKRWKYYQRILNEDHPKGRDQRKVMILTRYGHKFEMRDVGWSHTREGEIGEQKTIAKPKPDQRWIKVRTKGGHLIESIDIGCDEKKDRFVKRHLIEEIGDKKPLDKEDKFGKDARQIRFVARTGRKIVIDDRQSHKTKAEDKNLKNSEIGIGIMVKGRASPGARCKYPNAKGKPTGYYWQLNERPGKNHTVWGSPLGQTMEINDNEEAIIICNRLPSLPERCKFLGDNEFLKKSALDLSPHRKTHHLIIDLQREVIRLKSRVGRGQAPQCPKWGRGTTGEHQGLEIHDAPANNPWIELIDSQRRGVWFSKQQQLGIWRARQGRRQYIWMDDGRRVTVIHNAEPGGKIQIFCEGNIEVIGRNVGIQARETITMKAPDGINFQVGSARYAFTDSALSTNVDVKMRNSYAHYPQIRDGLGGPPGSPSGSGKQVSNLQRVPVPTKEPSNRL